MTAIMNSLNRAAVAVLAAPASRTATLTGTGLDVEKYEGVGKVVLHSTAASAGTNPTLDVKVQDSPDNSTGWADIPGATFAQVTDAASLQAIHIDLSAAKKYIRVVGTLGGTSTPTFLYGVELLAHPKYVS